MTDYPMLIGGELVEGRKTLGVVNPATEESFATVARASEKDAEAAIGARPRGSDTGLSQLRYVMVRRGDRVCYSWCRHSNRRAGRKHCRQFV